MWGLAQWRHQPHDLLHGPPRSRGLVVRLQAQIPRLAQGTQYHSLRSVHDSLLPETMPAVASALNGSCCHQPQFEEEAVPHEPLRLLSGNHSLAQHADCHGPQVPRELPKIGPWLSPLQYSRLTVRNCTLSNIFARSTRGCRNGNANPTVPSPDDTVVVSLSDASRAHAARVRRQAQPSHEAGAQLEHVCF